MAKIVALSSFVAQGGVGLRAHMGVFRRPDDDMIAVPTVVLSAHLGHSAVARQPIAAKSLADTLDALDRDGALTDVAAVITGYLPTADHVKVAATFIDQQKKRGAMIVVDPVLGDDPGGLYIDATAAAAVRALLLRHADVLTPNRFELAYLSDHPVTDGASAVAAARHLQVATVIATSVPNTKSMVSTLAVTASDFFSETAQRRPHAPHGTGDLLAALITRHLLNGTPLPETLSLTIAGVNSAIALAKDAQDLSPFATDWG